jgi:alcohol dehydrogenase class IV
MIGELIGDMVRAAGVASLPGIKRAAGGLTRLIPIPQPLLLVGPGAAARLGQAIADFGHRRLLVVTDSLIARMGLMAPLTDALRQAGTPFVVFDAITADAPIPQVEQGIELYRSEGCDGVVAFGGGSVMDAAKVIALAAANDKRPRDLAGYFRGLRAPAPIYAVPTTAGTGSEVTVAALISDPDKGKKYMVLDTRIVPEMAALDPTLMLGLPPAVTAATGMDALTHAVEAFISDWATPSTDRLALAATTMIWQYLPRAVHDGSDLQAREKMALAATYAGLAFTRANVGNVHALAHQLGGRYHVPHGLANAVLLPEVLRWSLPSCTPRLAKLAERVGLRGNGDKASATKFVDAVQAMNDAISIPRTLDALREVDIAELALAACWEADTNYPVPQRMTPADAQALLRAVLPGAPKITTKKMPRRKAATRKAPRAGAKKARKRAAA